jgi:hypothetical protein
MGKRLIAKACIFAAKIHALGSQKSSEIRKSDLLNQYPFRDDGRRNAYAIPR